LTIIINGSENAKFIIDSRIGRSKLKNKSVRNGSERKLCEALYAAGAMNKRIYYKGKLIISYILKTK